MISIQELKNAAGKELSQLQIEANNLKAIIKVIDECILSNADELLSTKHTQFTALVYGERIYDPTLPEKIKEHYSPLYTVNLNSMMACYVTLNETI